MLSLLQKKASVKKVSVSISHSETLVTIVTVSTLDKMGGCIGLYFKKGFLTTEDCSDKKQKHPWNDCLRITFPLLPGFLADDF
jgi:hypothetical protein